MIKNANRNWLDVSIDGRVIHRMSHNFQRLV